MQNYLQLFADRVTYTVLGLAQGSPLASSVNFFVNDIIWVSLLLAVVVFGIAIVPDLHHPPESEKGWRQADRRSRQCARRTSRDPTPFCSCSAVPLFIGFVESGVPLGITFSFLIASPLINEVAAACCSRCSAGRLRSSTSYQDSSLRLLPALYRAPSPGERGRGVCLEMQTARPGRKADDVAGADPVRYQ